MIIYEVTAKVGEHLSDDFEQYMRNQHIPDVLRTGAFKSASFLIAKGGLYQIRYGAETQDALDRYLDDSSMLLRQDVANRFPQGVEFTRSQWNLIQTWKS